MDEEPGKYSYLVITKDQSVLNPSSPAGKFIADLSSLVSQLHVIHIGSLKQAPQKINENTWLYTARALPLLTYFNIYQIILSQLVWKRRFLPSTIISLGDEINIAHMLSRRYHRPLYVFYSYMKVLGKATIPLGALVHARPTKIFVPNAYVEKAIESHFLYKSSATEVKILPEYIDVSNLEGMFKDDNIDQAINSRNKIFTIVAFPRHANIKCFSMIRKISEEVLTSIARFQFNVVVKKNQMLQAKILRRLFKIPINIVKEDNDFVNLLHTSRVTIYFDKSKAPYEPVLYSFIAGCPVLSSGDEYSKIILFNSGLEEYSHLPRDGRAFGLTIRKFINDPYLYTKYKMNCIGFAKTAFGTDREAYMKGLKEGLLQSSDLL